MGVYQLVNIPPASATKVEIRGIVDGEMVKIVRAIKNSDEYVLMCSTLVGDHMFAMPDALRKMYASDIVTAIRMARDAGYSQAQAEIRAALGIKK